MSLMPLPQFARLKPSCAVFINGQSVINDPADHGGLSSRPAQWWCNMFTTQFYRKNISSLECASPTSFAEMVHNVTNGRLRPLITDQYHTLGGRNTPGQLTSIAPKYVASWNTISQRLDEYGQPGRGMLQVTGSSPPEFEKAPAEVREIALGFPPGWVTHPALNLSEPDQCHALGNVCSPISVEVMLRMACAYSSHSVPRD